MSGTMRKKTITLYIFLALSNIFWVGAGAYYFVVQSIRSESQDKKLQQTRGRLFQALLFANENIIGKTVSEVKSEIPTDIYGKELVVKKDCLVAAFLCLKIDENSTIINVSIK